MKINSLEYAFLNIGLEEEKNLLEKQLSVSIGNDSQKFDFLSQSSNFTIKL